MIDYEWFAAVADAVGSWLLSDATYQYFLEAECV